MLRLLCAVAFILSFASASEPKVAKSIKPVKIECTKGSVKRTIEVTADRDGCKVYYKQPYDNPRLIGSAKHELAVCDKVKKKVIGVLTRAGLVCE